MTKYQITLTEEQLRLVANAIEDWSRFISGQTEMDHATSMIESVDNMRICRDLLGVAHPFIVPVLYKTSGPAASYSWSGIDCPNAKQRKAIAMSYMIYREIMHQFALDYGINNVYASQTLTCNEQGPLIEVKKLD